MELISREEAIVMLEDMEGRRDEDGYIRVYKSDVIANLRSLSSVDLIKRGEWKISSFTGNWYCNICGNEPYHSNLENMNYCPNCGAKMERRRIDERNIHL